MENKEKYLVLLLITIILPMIITILYYDIILWIYYNIENNKGGL